MKATKNSHRILKFERTLFFRNSLAWITKQILRGSSYTHCVTGESLWCARSDKNCFLINTGVRVSLQRILSHPQSTAVKAFIIGYLAFSCFRSIATQELPAVNQGDDVRRFRNEPTSRFRQQRPLVSTSRPENGTTSSLPTRWDIFAMIEAWKGLYFTDKEKCFKCY